MSRSKVAEPHSRKTIIVSKEHVCDALTGFLQALSILDDDHEVTGFIKVPEGLEVKVEEAKYDD